MMNTVLQLALPLSLLFAPSPDDGPKRERGGKIAQLDADSSGSISKAEADGTRLAAHFAEIDANSDGEVTQAEIKTAREARRAERGADGKRNAKGKHKGKRGADCDGKGKGKHKAKRAQMRKQLAERDANGDGEWSAEEVEGTPLARHFAKIDADSNGSITKEELKTARKARKAEHKGKHKAKAKGKSKGKSKAKGKAKAKRKGKRDQARGKSNRAFG